MAATGRNNRVLYKLQSVLGTPETGAGGAQFRYNDSTSGLSLKKAKVRSNESRSDGMSTRGRHGSHSVDGVYPADATLGTFEALIAAALKHSTGAFAADLVITQATASLTSITTTTNTIVAAAGSWITAGLKLGDIFRLTQHSTAANNSKNLGPILALTASTITLPAAQLTTDAAPDATFTITRVKKAQNGTTRSLWTFEEIEDDNDASAQFPDCRINSWKVSLGPDSMVSFEFGVVGRKMNVLSGASSPGLTTTGPTTTIPLVAVDATLYLGSTAMATLTALEFMTNLNAKTQPVVASLYSPDVYENNMAPIAGSFSAIRDDMALLSGFLAETEYAISLLCVEPDAEPKDFMHIYLPLVTLDGNTKQFGVDGPLIQSVPFEAGKMLSGTNVDNAMIVVQSTAAA